MQHHHTVYSLMVASYKGKLAEVAELIRRGADVNLVVAKRISEGSDVNPPTENEVTPLQFASQYRPRMGLQPLAWPHLRVTSPWWPSCWPRAHRSI